MKNENIPENYDVFYDIIIENQMAERDELTDLEECKAHLQKIDHPQKDNPSFCYEFFQFCIEPFNNGCNPQ